MKAYELSKQFENKYHTLVGEELGVGADGDCYSITNDEAKAIKFSVYYCWQNTPTEDVISSRLKQYKYVQENSDIFANLYDYGLIGQAKRKVVTGIQDYLLFFNLMEKLDKISADETKVFHSLLSHEDNNLKKDYSINKTTSILNGLSKGLDFDFNKVMLLIKRAHEIKSKYVDIHPRNIMKTKQGDFKFIDFDRIDM